MRGFKMIKVLYFLICMLIIVNPVYAEKTEWIDSGYNFTKVKSICIDYAASPEITDGIRDKEAKELFFNAKKFPLKKNRTAEQFIYYTFFPLGFIFIKFCCCYVFKLQK